MIETYTQISQNLKNGKFSKIYLLMGEETFFTDKISNFFQNEFIDEYKKGRTPHRILRCANWNI